MASRDLFLGRLTRLGERSRPYVGPWIVVLAAFILAIGPRLDFPHPIHVDEWTHLAYAEALIQDGTLPHAEPLYGQGEIGFRPETGFRVLLAEARLATGLAWEEMFPALAGTVFALFVVTMLYLGRALNAGYAIGILALGTPTTLRFLGPAFVVPVAVAMALLAALALVLVQPEVRKGWQGSVAVFLLVAALFLIHPPTGLVATPVVAAIACYVAVREPQAADRRALWASALAGLTVPLAWLLASSGLLGGELAAEAGRAVTDGQGAVRDYALVAGPVRLAALGVAFYAILRWRLLETPSLPYLGLVSAYGLLLLFIVLHSMGLAPLANLYDRSWLYLDMLVSVAGGLGLVLLFRKTTAPGGPLAYLKRWQGAIAGLLALAVGVAAWSSQSAQPLYRLTTAAVIEDFRWIRQNLADTPGLTLIDPLTSVTYPAIAGRPVYASASEPKPSPQDRVLHARALLGAPRPDLQSLRAAGISIVYDPAWKEEEGLLTVRPGIFLVLPDGPSESSTQETTGR